MGKDRPRRARHRNLQSGAKALGFLGVRLAGGRNALGAGSFLNSNKPIKEFVVATRAKKTAKGKKKAVKKATKKAVKALARKLPRRSRRPSRSSRSSRSSRPRRLPPGRA